MISHSYYHVICFNYFHCPTEPHTEEVFHTGDIASRDIATRQVGVSADVGAIVAGGSELGGVIGVFSRQQNYHNNKSDTAPPPYEEPPPYHIAVIMEQCQASVVSYPVLV